MLHATVRSIRIVLPLLAALAMLVGFASSHANAQYTTLTVQIGDGGALGQVLVDASNGRTLYIFTRDEAGKSNCSGMCAMTWPPLIVTSDTVEAPPEIAADFTVITRDDGSKQAAYKGMPLYLFARDTAPGQTNGQNVGGVWFVAAP